MPTSEALIKELEGVARDEPAKGTAGSSILQDVLEAYHGKWLTAKDISVALTALGETPKNVSTKLYNLAKRNDKVERAKNGSAVSYRIQ